MSDKKCIFCNNELDESLFIKNKEQILKKQKEYKNNPDYYNEYQKQRKKEDINFKLISILRLRIWNVLNGKKKK